MVCRTVITALLIVCCISGPAHAEWIYDGSPVSQEAGHQILSAVVADAEGSIFVVFVDDRDQPTNQSDVYVQLVDANGNMRWTANGKPVADTAANEQGAVALPDGAGGVFIAWTNSGTGTQDVYAQRLSASGSYQWGHGGVPVCTAADSQQDIRLVSDDNDGVFVAWRDYRKEVNGEIYAQRLNASGSPVWKADGTVMSAGNTGFSGLQMIQDGAGGAIVAASWRPISEDDIYAQRFDRNGVPQWGSGVPISDEPGDQLLDGLVDDSMGGAIAVWRDDTAGNDDIYAQRVDASGNKMWTTEGVPVCTDAGEQFVGDVEPDGAGGVFVVWTDQRNADDDIYGQRLSAGGIPLWTGNGHPICAEAGNQMDPTAIYDGSGGYILAWMDSRIALYDLYAQRINGTGYALWAAGGVPVTLAANWQSDPRIASDGNGGGVVLWEDKRTGQEIDLFAQRLEPLHGGWGYPEPVVTSVNDSPGDQGGWVRVNWNASGHDQSILQEITHYSVWRAIDALSATAALAERGDGGPKLVTPADIGPDFSGRALYRDTRARADYYWEWIGNQTAHYLPGYSYTAPTVNDSTESSPAVHYFMVMAHTADPFVSWPSNAHSGYSVDNLAPAAPLSLVAERVGNYVRLDWLPGGEDEPDFAHYAVYRAFASGVTPEPAFFLSTTEDTTLWDQDATPGIPWYYIVTSVDIHGTESEPSNEANVGSSVTGVNDTPRLTRLQVRSNVPNPFSIMTLLEVGLPADADVAIEVFDVGGRRVWARNLRGAAGWQQVTFDGRDDAGHPLPSGVYFTRVRAGSDVVTRKMVLKR